MNKRQSLRRQVQAYITPHKHRAAVALLCCGWALLVADAIPAIPLTLPDPLSDLIGWSVVSGTVILAVAALVRGPLMYAAMRIGKQLATEASGIHVPRHRAPSPFPRELADEPTHGIGVSN